MIFRLRRPMKWRIFENANLQNEIFRGGDLYYICANLGGFSFRCFFPAKQTLVSSLFSNFALVKRF